MMIFIAKNGTSTGPFTEEQVRGMVFAGMVSSDDLAWTEGSAAWQPLYSVLALSPPALAPEPGGRGSGDSLATRGVAEPAGIGGWLVFFCVGLTILSPLVSIGQIVRTWEQARPAFARFPEIRNILVFENIGLGLLLVLGFVVGAIVWSGSSRGRVVARGYLLIRLFWIVVVEVIALALMSSLPKPVFIKGVSAVAGAVFREVIFFAIWWAYFKMSKRVRNTYTQ